MGLRLALSLVMMAAACALSACGGDDDAGSGDTPASNAQTSADERQVRAVVTEALTSKDPDACTRLFTRAAVERFTYRRGRKAIAECRDEADEVAATSVTISRVGVTGQQAEADAEPKGGNLPLRKVTFALRQVSGRWRIDRLTAGTLDRDAFFREAREDLRKPPDALPAEATECVLADLRMASDEELVGFYTKSDIALILLPTVICALRSELPRTQEAAPFVRCVTTATRREMTSGRLGRELADEPDLGLLDSERYQAVIEQITEACARETLPGASDGSVS